MWRVVVFNIPDDKMFRSFLSYCFCKWLSGRKTFQSSSIQRFLHVLHWEMKETSPKKAKNDLSIIQSLFMKHPPFPFNMLTRAMFNKCFSICKLAWIRLVLKSNWTHDLEAFQPKPDLTSSGVKPQQETCVHVALWVSQCAPVCAADPNESAFSSRGGTRPCLWGVCLKNCTRKERCHEALNTQKQRPKRWLCQVWFVEEKYL